MNVNNIALINDALKRHDFSAIVNSDNVDDSFVQFNDVIMKYFDEYCPVITKSVSHKNVKKPWIDSGTRRLISRRDNCYKLFRSGIMSWDSYKRYRNMVTDVIRRKRKDYFHAKFDELKSDLRRT